VLVKFGVHAVPWTVVEIADDLSFEQLLSKIKAGCFKCVVKITKELRLSVVKGAFVGLSRDNLSTMSITASIVGFQLIFKIRRKC